MKLIALLTAATVGLTSAAAMAQEKPMPQELARQGLMWTSALNLGILGKMAKGEMAFDAAQAQLAADSIVAISQVNMGILWPEGSDNFSSDFTRADPKIWENPDDFAAKWADFGKAAKGLQAAVAAGQAALGPAMGAAGGSCKACHDNYRGPKT